MIKSIFFDIDGTLVSFKTHEIPKSTFDALYQLKEKGIRLFIATGRGKDGLGVLNDFPFDGYITLNGQYCFDGDGHVVFENFIKKESMQILLDYEKAHPFPLGITLEGRKIFTMRDERVDAIHAITHNDDHPVGDTSNVLNEKVYQCMAFIDEAQEEALLKQLPDCISARWHPLFTDITPVGGTKSLGIDKFMEYYGLSLEDTMAVGDGGNDLAMLGHVHTSIAMGNANDAVKEACDYVTKDVDEDGIYHAMLHFGLIDA